MFIPDIVKSLPVVEAMCAKGVYRIGCPLRAAGSLHILVGSTLVVLFDYIAAEQSYHYDHYVLGRLLAQVHTVTPDITVDIPKETFHFAHRGEFDRRFEVILTATGDADSVIQSAQDVLRNYEAEIRRYYAAYLRLMEVCKTEASACDMVITHGDARETC